MNKKVLIGIIFPLSMISIWLTFTQIDWLNQIQEIVQESGIWGYVIFVGAYAIATLLIFPVTAFNIAGGAVFGGIMGLLLASVGALISAVVGFFLVRSLNINFPEVDKRYPSVSENIASGGLFYVFVARLLPLVPYGIVSFAAGLSSIKRRDYILGSLLGTPLGIIPFVFLGSTGIQMANTNDLRPLVMSCIGLVMLIIAGIWYQKRTKDVAKFDEEEESILPCTNPLP
jgi:uncharacterized membrane protein YdjX (TVP38/TMEM64 family)